MAEKLHVAVRDERGSRWARRSRRQGRIPAVLYGHGEQNVMLSVSADELASVMRHGTKVVELEGGLSESALIRDIQWDAFGAGVLHIDLTRVSASEKVEVSVAVELRGIAPGANEGGIIEQPLREISILCPAASIPEKFDVSINSLHVGDAVTVEQLQLPSGASLRTPADAVLVQCVKPLETPEELEEAAPIDSSEPEVIGKKPEEEEEG